MTTVNSVSSFVNAVRYHRLAEIKSWMKTSNADGTKRSFGLIINHGEIQKWGIRWRVATRFPLTRITLDNNPPITEGHQIFACFPPNNPRLIAIFLHDFATLFVGRSITCPTFVLDKISIKTCLISMMGRMKRWWNVQKNRVSDCECDCEVRCDVTWCPTTMFSTA